MDNMVITSLACNLYTCTYTGDTLNTEKLAVLKSLVLKGLWRKIRDAVLCQTLSECFTQCFRFKLGKKNTLRQGVTEGYRRKSSTRYEGIRKEREEKQKKKTRSIKVRPQATPARPWVTQLFWVLSLRGLRGLPRLSGTRRSAGADEEPSSCYLPIQMAGTWERCSQQPDRLGNTARQQASGGPEMGNTARRQASGGPEMAGFVWLRPSPHASPGRQTQSCSEGSATVSPYVTDERVGEEGRFHNHLLHWCCPSNMCEHTALPRELCIPGSTTTHNIHSCRPG